MKKLGLLLALLCPIALFAQSAVVVLPPPDLPLTGGTLTGPLILNADPVTPLGAATEQYVLSQVSAQTGTTGTTSSNVFGPKVVTDGTVSYKVCYVGSSTCSGGVGSNAPASPPTVTTALNTPTASTGTANAVAHYQLKDSLPGTYTDVLWTTTGAGTANSGIYYHRDAWEKATFAAGTTNLEFDTWMFDTAWDWMFGMQCNGASHVIQYANQSSSWQNTSVSCSTLMDGNFHHIIANYHRDLSSSTACSGSPCLHFDDITIDGTKSTINTTMPATTTGWSGVGDQWQLDADPTTASSGTPAVYDLYADTDTLTVSTQVATSGSSGTTVTGTMGNLASFNFDSSASTPSTSTGSPTLDNTVFFTPSDSASFTASAQYYTIPYTAASTENIRVLLNIGTTTTTNMSLLQLFASGAQVGSLFLQGSNGVLTSYNNAVGAGLACSSGALTTNAWHTIELQWTPGATAGSYTVWVDNVQTCTFSGNTGTGTPNSIRVGDNSASSPWAFHVDNIDVGNQGRLGLLTVTATSATPAYDPYGAAKSAQATAESFATSAIAAYGPSGSEQFDTPLPTMGTVTATPSTTGGTLAAGTYYYKVTELDSQGETLPSVEASATTTGTTGSVALSWPARAGAASFNIYRGTTAGGESVSFNTTTNSFTDTGAAGTADTPPTSDTSGVASPTLTTATRASLIKLHSNATGFTLPYAADGWEKTLSFCQDPVGGFTVVWPNNIRGNMTVGTTASKCSSQHFTYYASQGAWLADSPGVVNQ